MIPERRTNRRGASPLCALLFVAALVGPACSPGQGSLPTDLAHTSSNARLSSLPLTSQPSPSASAGEPLSGPGPAVKLSPGTSAITERALPSEVFAAKIRFLDQIDQAVVGGPLSAFQALSAPESTFAGCSSSARERLGLRLEVSEDCVIPAGASVKRMTINVGDRIENMEEGCPADRLEKSELFYRVGDRSLKITVDAFVVGTQVHLSRIRCHKGRSTAVQKSVANCSGKWPLVVGIESAKCPWAAP